MSNVHTNCKYADIISFWKWINLPTNEIKSIWKIIYNNTQFYLKQKWKNRVCNCLTNKQKLKQFLSKNESNLGKRIGAYIL